MLVLHPYVPGLRPADQQKSWEALSELPKHWVTDLRAWPCTGDLDYADGLNRYWDEGEVMVLVEHDIAPTWDEVVELWMCPHPFCAMDYAGPGWPSWAANPDASCIGFAKLDGRLRQKTDRRPVVPRVHWHDVGGVLTQVFGRPHIHEGPVAHYHS